MISYSGTLPNSTGCPSAVTTGITTTVSPAAPLFSTQIWTQLVRFKNTSGSAISGPIVLALNNLGSNAKLFTAGGTGTCPADNGEPYIYVTNGMPANGNAAVVLTFTNTEVPSAAITYTPVVLSGGTKL